MRTRRQFNGAFKAKVVLEALREQKTIHEIAQENGIHPHIISVWKKKLFENLPQFFDGPSVHVPDEKEKDDLHKKIGQLAVEVDWLKKKSGRLSR